MRNFKVTMAYNGAAYHGFQRQNNAMTVQQAVEEAMGKLLGETVSVNGCSRTDAGVHAREYVFSFSTENAITEKGVVIGTNSLLPGDISILDCKVVDDSFHARYNCKGKEYEYLIHNHPVRDPFLNKMAMQYKYPLDEKLLDREGKQFVGTYDFRGFCSADCTQENTVRTISSFSAERQGDLVRLKVAGNGFLYNMVRIMVGTLIYINEGKLPQGCIKELIEKKDRTAAGVTVPPDGLYLNKVYY